MVGRPRTFGPRERNGKPQRASVAERIKRAQQANEPDHDLGTPEHYAARIAVWGASGAVAHQHTREIAAPADLLEGLGRLDEDQHFAARKACAIYHRHCAAILPPRVVTGQLRGYIQGSRGEPLSPDDAEEAKTEYDQMRRAVLREVRHRFRANEVVKGLSQPGPISRQAWRALHDVVMGKMPHNIYALGLACDALVDHYDMQAKRQTRVYRRDIREAA